MLRRNAENPVSFGDGFRIRGFLPLLAMMLLVAPQLAFAQDSLLVTVDPRSLDLNESSPGNKVTGTYTVRFTADPKENVVVTVAGALVGSDCADVPDGIKGILVSPLNASRVLPDPLELPFNGGDDDNPDWDTEQTVDSNHMRG